MQSIRALFRTSRAQESGANARRYWGTPSRAEARPLEGLVTAGTVSRAYAVYEGTATLRGGSVDGLPVTAFLKRLYAGEIIG